jgi:hypothetical protein
MSVHVTTSAAECISEVPYNAWCCGRIDIVAKYLRGLERIQSKFFVSSNIISPLEAALCSEPHLRDADINFCAVPSCACPDNDYTVVVTND